MLSQDEQHHWMRQALAVAEAGLSQGELPIGAIVVLDKQIIGSAYTMERSEQRLLVHADLLALSAADQLKPFPGQRRDARLFVTLEPCLMCLGAAMSFCVGEVYYAVESPGDGAGALVEQWQRKAADFPSYRVPAIVSGVLRDESIALFQAYTQRYTTGGMAAWTRTIAAL